MPEPPRAAGVDVSAEPDLATLRRWLRSVSRPERLADADAVALLRSHERLPAAGSPVAVGEAAAHLIVEAVERLRVPTTAPRQQQLPYLVLKICFLDEAKRYTAAARLGMSERQVTRERTRALQLLQAQLAPHRGVPSRSPQGAEPIPRIGGYLDRPGVSERLAALLAEHRLVHVAGPRGAGKTCLVAEYAVAASARVPVVWYQLRAGLNDTLTAFLFDLLDTLRPHVAADRADAVAAALTAHDAAVASRLALHALRDVELLLVIDDYQFAESDPLLTGFVEEATTRLPTLTVLTVSRRRERGNAGAVLQVSPMSLDETAALLAQLRIGAAPALVEVVHRWTKGLPQLVTFAASWLKTATDDEVARGTTALADLDDVQEFLLNNITDLIDPDDRHILGAASVFRDRFTDDALAYVAERSRGQVLDTSRRLVRYYLATRAADGEVAFFHESVRDYIQARLRPSDKAVFHQRASAWYERQGDPDEAGHHRQCAKEA
jgi:ATP/maltotriose-dependent transcriptional regulator MalT